MACCADKTQNEADACCANGEAQQNADASSPAAMLSLPAIDAVTITFGAAIAPASHASIDLEAHTPLTSESGRHVLLSVFLI
jgi:hypothetical protein